MNRCFSPWSTWLAAALLLLSFSACQTAWAQAGRTFPQQIKRGKMAFLAPPVVELNGAHERLSPGVRIRNQRNASLTSGRLRGQKFVVNYRRDASGHINEVWILTPLELQKPLAPQHQWRPQKPSRYKKSTRPDPHIYAG